MRKYNCTSVVFYLVFVGYLGALNVFFDRFCYFHSKIYRIMKKR